MLQRSQQLLSDRHVAEVSESPPCKRPTSKDHLFGQRKTRKRGIRGRGERTEIDDAAGSAEHSCQDWRVACGSGC